MSYADKHRHTAGCADARCEDPGTILKLYQGKPYWWCQTHADSLIEPPRRHTNDRQYR